MLIYTLGVIPAEPGFTRARVAPRLGRLAWVKGSLPTPFGTLTVEITPELMTVNAPIPFDVDLEGQPTKAFPAGRHRIPFQS